MNTTRNPRDFEIIGARRFHEMRPGDMFRAMIHDIRKGEVTLKFNDGTMYTARSLVLPDARIGEDTVFLVRENDFEGRIVLEMVKLAPQTKQDNMLREALHHANLSPSHENLAWGRKLLAAGLPVDSATLHNACLNKIATNPNALMEATAEEIKEITRLLSRTAARRTYHRLNRNAELHVFKKSALTSAVLVVQTVSLGRVEVFIEWRSEAAVGLVFRCENLHIMEMLAAQKGNNATYELTSAPFTILSPPPLPFSSENKNASDTQEETLTPTRFNFDIRV